MVGGHSVPVELSGVDCRIIGPGGAMGMRMLAVLVLLLVVAGVVAQERPRGVSVYTWTREDLFAGLLTNDWERLSAGMKKLDEILRATPGQVDAVVMKGFGEVVLAVKSHESGDRAAFDHQYQQGVRRLEEAYAAAPKSIGVLAVYGATMALLAPRFPAELQKGAWEKGKLLYEALYREQETVIDKYPPHMKGEVLGALADMEHRLGNTPQARAYLTRIVEGMAGTSYQTRAKQWLENPEKITAKNRMMCLTCHEPGRLQNRLAELQKTSQ